jgi:hypothetical protein
VGQSNKGSVLSDSAGTGKNVSSLSIHFYSLIQTTMPRYEQTHFQAKHKNKHKYKINKNSNKASNGSQSHWINWKQARSPTVWRAVPS